MTDFKQKLARLGSPVGRSGALPPAPARQPTAPAAPVDGADSPERSSRIEQLRALIGEVVQRDQKRRLAHEEEVTAERRPLPWPVTDTAHGPLYTVERWLEPDHHHGNAPVAAAIAYPASTLAALALDPSVAELDLSRMLFLDTETTGLSGGTGTVAFLVGLARFEEGVLRIEQLVVPSLGAEAPVLARLAERLREASCLVTYNGKSFDWPLLRTRFVLARMPAPPLPPHVDLLHATRRLWKPRLGGVRLTEIEREILRFEREGDIDGAEIPSRYFGFLRDGIAERLLPVIEHNQNDLIALAAMLGKLGQHFESSGADADPRDNLAFARLALRASDAQRALSFARAALEASGQGGLKLSALTLLGQVHRRFGDCRAAAEVLEQAVPLASSCNEADLLHFALAKLYEHELGELALAYRHALHSEAAEGPLSHGRRLGRLRRRLERRALLAATPATAASAPTAVERASVAASDLPP
ncbi:MAG TPA: ribonuclease H-like domain-containing protein [Polyangiales bacterium]